VNNTDEVQLTVAEMKNLLGYKNDVSVLRLIRRGELNASFIKNRYLVEDSEFNRFLESRKGARANDVRKRKDN